MSDYLLLALGLILLTAGADFFVRGASAIATRLGLSELVIVLTVVAFGTCAPELAVSVKSALAGQGGIAIGNIVGSNIFTILGISAISAIVSPINPEGIQTRDILVMIASSIILLPLMRTGFKLVRWESAVLFAGFLAYL